MDENSTTESETEPSTSMTEDTESDVPLLESPLPPKCPYCPLPLREDDPDLPVIALKRQRGVDNCNEWAKRRRIDVIVQVNDNICYIRPFLANM